MSGLGRFSNLKLYGTALLVMALIVTSFGYMMYILERNEDLGRLVDKAGRQRMLLRSISLSAIELSGSPRPHITQKMRTLLDDSRATMLRAHEVLANGDPENGIEKRTEPELLAFYFSEPHALDRRVREFLAHAEAFAQELDEAAADGPEGRHVSENFLELTRETAGPLLDSLNAAVQGYVDQIGKNNRTLWSSMMASFVLVIAVLAYQFGVLLLPKMKRLRGEIDVLTAERDKTEEHARLKSEFLATMSHEIRTPMNGILGMAELIMSAKPTKQVEAYTRTIIHSGETLLRILNDILDFSKIESGKLELDPIATNLRELLYEEAALFAVKARAKSLEIVIDYAPGTEENVIVDPVRVRQVVTNLLGNAIKFTEDGYIVVSANSLPGPAERPGNTLLELSIADTGIGLSDEAQSRIFEKFEQADGSTTRQYGGTGLGLAICKQLVEMMGGTISVTSTIGEGSKFAFTLDVPVDIDAKPAVTQKASLGGLRVIVVDDVPAIGEICTSILEYHGVVCTAVQNPHDALQLMLEAQANGTPYEIALIDYMMPSLRGDALAAAIDSYEELSETCLILMTSAGAPFTDDDIAKKGFNGLVEKPLRGRDLARVLEIVWSEYRSGRRHAFIRVYQESSVRPAPDDADLVLPGRRVLVAEDNTINQVFVSEILEEMQVETVLVSNGRAAVETFLEGQTFDIVLMDCQMPEMDGYEATGKICEMKAAGKVANDMPIVALTANALREDRQKCLDAGMDEYLTKPVRKHALKALVYKLVSGREGVMAAPVAVEPERLLAAGDQAVVKALAAVHEDAAASKQDGATSGADATPDDGKTPLVEQAAVDNARAILKAKYDDMLKLFITNSEERLEEMKAAVESGSAQDLVRPAHTLKSTARQMGAIRLSDISKELETIAKSAAAEEGGRDIKTDERITSAVEEAATVLADTRRALTARAA